MAPVRGARGRLRACAWIAAPAAAQVTIPEEYGKVIKTAEAIGALGVDLFGEQTNFYTGATTFSATDVSLPGNDALPVAIGRRFIVQSRSNYERNALLTRDGGFADWELDIPHMHGVYSNAGWQVDGYTEAGKNARCTQPESASFEAPTVEGTFNRLWTATEYWAGTSLYVPGVGDQTMLMALPNGLAKPTDGQQYPWVTNGLWHIACLSSVVNGAGEGFLARSPQGVTYRFDWMVARPMAPITKNDSSGAFLLSQDATVTTFAPPDPNATSLNRVEVWILPTLVKDRFNNTVTYEYESATPWRLKRIVASDGRQLTLTYNAAGHIDTVSDGTRTWRYEYANGLTGVVLPDASRWTIDFSTLRNAYTTPTTNPVMCDSRSSSPTQSAVTGTITHPSGAVGAFTFQSQLHGRSYVTQVCRMPNYPYTTEGYAVHPFLFDAVGLTQKRITGMGLTPLQWNYTYGPANNSWIANCPSDSCVSTKTVEVTGSDGTWTRYTFGNRYKVSEGKLMKVETGPNASTILRTTETAYVLDPTNKPYPARIGTDPFIRSDFTSESFRPEFLRRITQQGTTFTWEVGQTDGVYDFDRFARPTRVIRSTDTTP